MLQTTQIEQALFWIVAAGGVLVVIGLIWGIVRAFRQKILWGIFFPLFPFFHWNRARLPVLTMLLGIVMVAGPVALNRFWLQHLDLGERDRLVDGERHLILTGWDKQDYTFLKDKPDTVVLFMANSDVDDQTLDHLKEMRQLRELDLGKSKITDAGLEKIAALPALRDLRIRGTAITDEGFVKHLLDKDSLMNIDLTGTKVKSATLRKWRAAKPDRRGLQ